jgi:hypothetical protein
VSPTVQGEVHGQDRRSMSACLVVADEPRDLQGARRSRRRSTWNNDTADIDLARHRCESVAAYRAWTQIADDQTLANTGLTEEQRVALR